MHYVKGSKTLFCHSEHIIFSGQINMNFNSELVLILIFFADVKSSHPN